MGFYEEDRIRRKNINYTEIVDNSKQIIQLQLDNDIGISEVLNAIAESLDLSISIDNNVVIVRRK